MLEIRLFVVALQQFKVGQNPVHLLLVVILAMFAPSQDGIKNMERSIE